MQRSQQFLIPNEDPPEDQPETYEGGQWEENFFGVRSNQFRNAPYADKNQVLQWLAANQNLYDWNPKAPKTKPAKKLFNLVKAGLPVDWAEKLELACAIGSAVDQHHGVDGFFTFEGIHDSLVIGIDLTTNPDKLNRNLYITTVYEFGDFEVLGDVIAKKLSDELGRVARSKPRSKRARESPPRDKDRPKVKKK